MMRRLRTFRHFNKNAECVVTPLGGIATYLINKTGAPSVAGSIVSAGTADNSVRLTPANAPIPVGVMYESGVPDGDYCLVVITGRAEVLLKDGTGSSAGNWVGVSDVAGRAIADMHPGATPPDTTEHNRELGHCLTTCEAGINVLINVLLHFN